MRYKGECISILPSFSPAANSFTSFIGVYRYIAWLLLTIGRTGEAGQRAPTFECRGLNRELYDLFVVS